jgi:hypothetical protein
MPRFEPFAGLRYHADIDLDAVTAPPYDVIDEQERAALAARTGYNAVRVDLPVDGEGEPGEDRYATAARFLAEFVADGVLVHDDAPSLYVYRMGHRDETGAPRQTTGVIGALGIELPGEGDVLPHEQTTPKAASDRLELLRATAANLSPIWGLSLGEGSRRCARRSRGAARRSLHRPEGVHHRIWRVTARRSSSSSSTRWPAHRWSSPTATTGTRPSRTVPGRAAADGGEGPWDLTWRWWWSSPRTSSAVAPDPRLLDGRAGRPRTSPPPRRVLRGVRRGPADASLPARMADAGRARTGPAG